MANDLSRILEFDRVLDLLARRCVYSVARERAATIGPSSDPNQVAYLLSITREAVDLLSTNPGFSVGGARDIRPVLDRAVHGALLLPTELGDVLDTVQAAHALRHGFFRTQTGTRRHPGLAEFVEAIASLPVLEAELARTVGPGGEILDSASVELAEIRRGLKSAHGRLLDRLNRMIASGEYAGALQDAIVTMREGRYVIPVKADHRGQVPGVVHGTSASGMTLFVEPLGVVELNNRWRELQMVEEHEVERILRARSDQVAQAAGDLGRSVEAVAALDLALAKARLAFDLRAREPILVDLEGGEAGAGHPRHRINLRQARHPLLDPATVVPIDIQLGATYRVLVITGPNTGGKTVALKTVGLLAMMAQSGLFIPAADGSALSVFPAIYADIGDEQSIEQSLSTFSSHMRRVIAMLRSADQDSLVLLDELGAGTDPQEGSALARAVIEALLERGSLAIVTTHYSELKAFAYITAGTENASVEFDVQTLAPTYRLLTGIPGRSNALAIARRLGLPEPVIADARRYLTPESERADEMLTEIQHQRAATEAALAAAREEHAAVELLQREVEEVLREAERLKTEARQEALAEVAEELAGARGLLRRLQARASVPAATETAPAEIAEARAELKAVDQQVRDITRRSRPKLVPRERFRIGDRVEVRSLGMQGEIVDLSEETGEADIQVGIFKVRQPVAVLRRADLPEPEPAAHTRYSLPPAPVVDSELHLRGMRAAAVQQELDRYLDAAARASLPWVRLVHGKGTGALRGVVHDVLRHHQVVDRFELAEPKAGGEGVTVAYLKD